jgi:putative ABC transport system substrate-binding protein
MKNLIKSIALLTLASILAACEQDHSNVTRIGIVIPLEHNAMNEIISGFSDTLKQQYPKSIVLDVKNAQNDPNLQRSIIQQMNDNNDQFIVTIGLGATQMATAMVNEKPIIGLAAGLSDEDRKAHKTCHVALVHDEISPAILLNLIKATNPEIKHVTLIHSSAEKVFPEVKIAVDAAKKIGINITPIMAATLPDLTSVAAAIPADSQAILVLKDNLIVSGISLLAKTAQQLHIPLISSDQGSVEAGAGFALGVHEREIGVDGAKLAILVLKGESPCELPVVEMKKLTVFVNEKALMQQSQNASQIEKAAKKIGYAFEITQSPKV